MNAPAPAVSIDAGRRIVRVRCETLRGTGRAVRAPLLGRLFSCQHVVSVRVSSPTATAEAQLDPEAAFADAVRDLARAVKAGDAPAAASRLPADCFGRATVTVSRVGGRLTTWRIGAGADGTVSFHHPRMRPDRVLARSLERLALTMPGVVDARLVGWSADLVIRLDAGVLDAQTLLAVLQHAVDERAGTPPASSPWEMLGPSTSLAVAATADLAVAALAPVSAVLLVGTNVRTIAAAVGDLRHRRLGLPTVTTAIVVGTLATGQFLAAGIMAWSLDFWRRRHRRDVEAERRLLLEDAVPLPACAAVATAAGQTSTRPAETIGPEARVPLGRWDVVPADGRVAEGGGVIDARCVTGVPGARVVRPGDLLEAGSVVLGGAVMLEVARPAAESRMARIAGLLAAATAPQPGRFAPTRAAEEFGERFAAPTLATAGLGLLAGDVATAVAIMRPDYANGEALAVSFEDLDAVARGLAAGCVLARPAALDALDTVDTILLVDHPRLRDRGTRVTRVVAGVAAGDEPQAESIRWAASLARHLADPRREALGALAAERGSVLVDIVPQSFGDAAGLRLVHGVGGRDVCLGEARTEQAAEWRPLVLEVAGRPAATFEFGPAPERAATRALDRLREIRGDRELRVLLAVDTAAARDTGTAETLAHELHCDGVVDVAGIGLAGQVRTLTQAGRRVACVGPAAAVAAAEDVATVTVGLGDEPPAAGIVALSGDVGCLADLCRAAGERRARLLLSRRLTILPNVACVAGAFLLGFTSLVAAVVTNLGTLGTYRRAAATLHHDRRRHWLRHRSISQGRPPWRAS